MHCLSSFIHLIKEPCEELFLLCCENIKIKHIAIIACNRKKPYHMFFLLMKPWLYGQAHDEGDTYFHKSVSLWILIFN